MSTLKKYDLQGLEQGHVKLDEKLISAKANGQMVKDYIVALQKNARQWSANTKGRSEVSHSTQKPHPQKGGGRARQGSIVAPQYKGGGRVFGPKPKFDQHIRINKKERQAAIRFLVSEKLRADKIHVVSDFNLDAPRTKSIVEFMKSQNLTGRVLFLGEGAYLDLPMEEGPTFSIGQDAHDNFIKSVRNIPKASFALVKNISGYDVLVAHHIVLTESALNELNEWLC
ncbi:MAG: 50S ribosomal protein L4 [Parachlamydiaceae bacterium]|nr:50S ribosomal protein L4 [Parachlamydiaceae bacterium]